MINPVCRDNVIVSYKSIEFKLPIISKDMRVSLDNGSQIETVCCLYHPKKDFISVPYEPNNADHMK